VELARLIVASYPGRQVTKQITGETQRQGDRVNWQGYRLS
jgi:hypothetical protein